MKATLFAALLLVFSAAFADCERVEYVELKDWSVEDIEKRYCLDERFFNIEAKTRTDLANLELERMRKLGATYISPSYTRDQEKRSESISACADELSKIARVLKNVHHRERPTCASADERPQPANEASTPAAAFPPRSASTYEPKALPNERAASLNQPATQGSAPNQQAQADLFGKSVAQIKAEVEASCARDEYKPLFIHTTCNANDLSLEKLADKSKLDESDKSLLSRLRSESHAFSKRLATAARAFPGPQGTDAALAFERADTLAEKNALALYEGTITWGDYNKRRKEIGDDLRGELNRIDRQRP